MSDVRAPRLALLSRATYLCRAAVIVKASSGPRYVVGIRSTVPKHKLKQGVRVSLDMTTLTIMRILPREVDPLVYNMSMEDPGGASFAGVGGLGEQIRELREVSGGIRRRVRRWMRVRLGLQRVHIKSTRARLSRSGLRCQRSAGAASAQAIRKVLLGGVGLLGWSSRMAC
jgi:hypothetical protein